MFSTAKGAVLTLGALATAVAAVIALVPKGSPGPASMRARFVPPISVYTGTTLYEYEARAKPPRVAAVSSSGRPSALQPVAYMITGGTLSEFSGQASDQGTTTSSSGAGSPPTPPAGGSAGTTTTTTTETTSSAGSTPSAPSSSTTPNLATLKAQVLPLVADSDLVRVAQATAQTLTVHVPDTCTTHFDRTRCGLTSIYEAEELQSGYQPAEAARKLAAMLAAARTEPSGNGPQPVGVMVAFRLQLVGFQGRRMAVVGALFPAAGAPPLSAEWSRPVQVLRVRPRRGDEFVSSQFWVPLPKALGNYFVHLLVQDEDNGPVRDFVDSQPFR